MPRRTALLTSPAKPFADVLARLVAAITGRTPADRYRPERHYMRGPGPKCRAKAGDAGADGHR
jgi:hypothetical protein